MEELPSVLGKKRKVDAVYTEPLEESEESNSKTNKNEISNYIYAHLYNRQFNRIDTGGDTVEEKARKIFAIDSKKLKRVANKLTYILLKRAPSFDDFFNMTTLYARLQEIAVSTRVINTESDALSNIFAEMSVL